MVNNSSTFPYGPAGYLGLSEAIVICRSGPHREEVIKALPIEGAMYTTWGAALAGARTKKVIVFDRVPDNERESDWQMEYLGLLRLKLASPEYQDQFFVV